VRSVSSPVTKKATATVCLEIHKGTIFDRLKIKNTYHYMYFHLFGTKFGGYVFFYFLFYSFGPDLLTVCCCTLFILYSIFQYHIYLHEVITFLYFLRPMNTINISKTDVPLILTSTGRNVQKIS
jgi:hypothetical protein